MAAGSSARDLEAAARRGAGAQARRRGCARARASRPGRGRRRAAPLARPGPPSRTASSSASAPTRSGRSRGAPRRVLADVGERLLHDPVRGQVERGGQRARRRRSPRSSTVDAGRRARARPAPAAAPARAAARARCPRRPRAARRACRRISPSASRAEPRIARSGAPGARRVALERGLGGVGLHGDHADAVGDDVVQLARDPRALLGDRDPLRVLARSRRTSRPTAIGAITARTMASVLADVLVVARISVETDGRDDASTAHGEHHAQVVDLDGERVEEQEHRDVADDEVAVGRVDPRQRCPPAPRPPGAAGGTRSARC